MSEVSLRIHSPQWYQQRLHGILMKNKEHSERARTQTNSLIGFFSEQPLLYDKALETKWPSLACALGPP